MSAAREQATLARVIDDYPFEAQPAPIEAQPSPIERPIQPAEPRSPFYVSVPAIIGISTILLVGASIWFACVVAVAMNGRSMVAGIAAGITTAAVLGCLVSSIGSFANAIVRWRFDIATVEGWVAGSVLGPLVLTGVGQLWVRYVVQTRAPKSLAPLVMLTTIAAGAVTSIGLAFFLPQILRRRRLTQTKPAMQYNLRMLLIWVGITPALLAGWFIVAVQWHKDIYGLGLIALAIISFGLLLSLWITFRNPRWDEQ